MELVVSEFTGELQQKILDKINKEYLLTGKYLKDQTSVSPKMLSSMMVASGATGTSISAAVSSSLFMATVNPATLMSAGPGAYYSAQMGLHGIVAQAPFVAVASSIPVVAPLMVAQTLSSLAMIHQFSAIDKKLDAIRGAIDKMMARQEVTKLAELFAAVHIVDELYLQYNQAGHFSTDMLIRLALAERDANILSLRYEMLDNSDTDNLSEVDFYNYDTYCTMLASFLHLRVKYLRTCVDVQENPESVQYSSESFTALLNDTITLWEKLLHKSDRMKNDIDGVAAQLEGAKGLQRKLAQMSKGKELSRMKEEYTAAMEKERIILKDFHSLIDATKQIAEKANAPMPPTLIYWCDHNGEHCIATNNSILDSVESSV